MAQGRMQKAQLQADVGERASLLNSWGFGPSHASPGSTQAGPPKGQLSGKEVRAGARGAHNSCGQPGGSDSGSQSPAEQQQEWLEAWFLNQDQMN